MTAFIPEWGPVSGAHLQLRRLFNELGDDAVVRTPLHPAPGQPDYFVECGEHWLALGLCRASYADIAADQLFEGEGRTAFLHYLNSVGSHGPASLPRLVLMWSCSEHEVAQLESDARAAQVLLCARSTLLDGGGAALRALMRRIPGEVTALKRRYFPESEINTVSVGRRQYHRDNSAVLTGIFLDSEQEWASKLDLDVTPEAQALAGSCSVRMLNGVAGSGKTLIALQRAILLAQRHPTQRVLILILNTPVVADLAERIHRAGRSLPGNLEMMTFARWNNGQWRRVFGAWPKLPASGEVMALVRRLRQELPLEKLDERQLVEEIDFINDTLLASEAAYLEADRAGRGFALRESDRRAVWTLYCGVTDALRARGMRLWSSVSHDICLAPSREGLQMYEHILVDEAQFLSPASLQVIKLSLCPGASIFLCADPRQGFMRSRLSWKSVGLDVAGRTRKLRRSYRTTSALLRSATLLLAREVEEDPEDYLAPDFTGMEAGVPPILLEVAAPQDAVDRVVNEIAALARSPGFPLSSVLVLYGERTSKTMLYRQLCAALGPAHVWWLNQDEHRKMPPGGYGGEHLRLASIDTATGLEGTFVFLLGVEDLLAGAMSAGERDAESKARKLYMAMTRSCYRLSVVVTEPFAPGHFAGIFEKRR